MTDDEGPARGWNLFKWKWLTQPREDVAAAVYGIFFIALLLILTSGLIGLYQLLAPLWSGATPPPAPSQILGVDPGAELRGRLLVIGALLTTPFLAWRLVVSHWAARAAQFQARIAQETARNSLFTKAIEQLGAMREITRTVQTSTSSHLTSEGAKFHDEKQTVPNTEVRLGAIYALEKLARDDPEMHWPIMETLCAYVRENSGSPAMLDEQVRKAIPTALLTTRSWNNLSFRQ